MPSTVSHDLSRPVREFVTPVDTTLQSDQTVAEAIASLRQRQPRHEVIYFYVVNKDNALVGIMPTRRLLLSQPDQKLADLMQPTVIHVFATDTLEQALEEFAIHRLLALPVLDEDKHLLGVVDVRLYAEEAFDLAEAHRSNDTFQMIGLSVEQSRQATPWRGFRLRLPWLLCNVASGAVCAMIALWFEAVLEAVVLLAMFFPLVLTLSESVSMQAMTAGLQFLHRQKVPWQTVRSRLQMEWKTVAMLSVACGVTVGVLSLFWGGGAIGLGVAPPAVVLALSIAGAMIVSAMIGLLMPVLLHTTRLEPKVASGPLTLMLADVIATASYLSLATLLLL